MFLSRLQKAIAGVVFALIITLQGCATKQVQPIPLDESDLSKKRIGVVINRTPAGKGLKTSGSESTAGVGIETAKGAHLIEQNFEHPLEERLIALAQESGCIFESLNDTGMSAGKPIDYESLSRKGFSISS